MNPSRTSLPEAVEIFGLPRWASTTFSAVPFGCAIASAIRGGSSLPWPVATAFLVAAALATVGDLANPRVPEVVLALVGLALLLPPLLTGTDRVALVIAWMIVLRAAGLGTLSSGLIALVASAGVTMAAAATSPGLPLYPFVIAGMAAASLAGSATRSIIRLIDQMRGAERVLAEEATREERRRLAREVHDVIAHSMTVTLLHVNGARLALHDKPEAAESALQRAEKVGRASLEDLRRTVSLLSDSSDPSLGTTVDLREDLGKLAEGYAGAAPISMSVRGEADAVPPYVAVTVYRIVQESMTNAMRYAPGSAVEVVVDVDDQRVSLRVANSLGDHVVPGRTTGRGLHGMFERASLVGGHLEAGPTKDGWVVAGWVPRDVPAGGVEV